MNKRRYKFRNTMYRSTVMLLMVPLIGGPLRQCAAAVDGPPPPQDHLWRAPQIVQPGPSIALQVPPPQPYSALRHNQAVQFVLKVRDSYLGLRIRVYIWLGIRI